MFSSCLWVNSYSYSVSRLMFAAPKDAGVVVIAKQQTTGRGRGGNTWISPYGCAMFSLHVRIPVMSRLGIRPPFLQHLMSLAVVDGVRSIPGYEVWDLTQWTFENGIYFSSLGESEFVKFNIFNDLNCRIWNLYASIGWIYMYFIYWTKAVRYVHLRVYGYSVYTFICTAVLCIAFSI